MAIDTPKNGQIMLLAAKLETTNGTPISITGSDADHIVYDFDWSPDDASIARPMPAAMGQDTSIVGAQTGTVKFRIQLAGKGSVSAVPAWADRFLPPCGYTKSGSTFSRSGSAQTVTIAWFEDGLKNILYGAMGTFKISGTNGQPVDINFEFKGIYSGETDVAILSPTFPSVLAPIWVGSTVSWGGFTPVLSKFELDAGNQLELRPDAAATWGYRCCWLPNHDPKLTIDPEASTVAARDWVSIYRAMTEESASISVGSASNNTITLSTSRAQTQQPKRLVRNGLIAKSITAQLNGATPFSVAFA